MNIRRIIAGVVISVCGLLSMSALPDSSAATTPVLGVDVSSFQHPNGARINWSAVARAGYSFAFIKDTEGTYYVNPWYKSDLRAARANGLRVASYHFANPAQSSGKAQANYAVDNGAFMRGMLRPVLDIERDPYLTGVCYGLSPSRMVTWISAYMRQFWARTGWWPMINTQPAWWNRCTGDSTAFGNRLLWVQDPGEKVGSLTLPAGWSTWRYWQYSITGSVPGIAGVTDLDRLN